MTCIDLELCRSQLAEARLAYHALMTTGRVVSIAHRDRQVEYNRLSAKDLASYIRELEAQCGCVENRRRPLMFGANPRRYC